MSIIPQLPPHCSMSKLEHNWVEINYEGSFSQEDKNICLSNSLTRGKKRNENIFKIEKKKLRLRPNILAKRLGVRSLSELMKNFSLGLLTD